MVCSFPHFYFSSVILLAIPWATVLLKPSCKWLCLCIWWVFTCAGFALIVNTQTHIHLQYQRARVTQVSAPDVSKSTGMSLVGHSFHGKIGSDGDSKVLVLSLPTSPSPEWWCVLLPSNWRCCVQMYLRTVSEYNSQYIFNEETNKQKTGGHLVKWLLMCF